MGVLKFIPIFLPACLGDERNLFRHSKRQLIRTTYSAHSFPVYSNHLKDREVTAINQLLVADITCIPILTGFVFLAVILDVFSRRVVGSSLAKCLDHHLRVAALKMALRTRNPTPELINHSDVGVQSSIPAESTSKNFMTIRFILVCRPKGNP